MESKKVLVGMSGGTDSSVACIELMQQGYQVVGVTMVMWTKESDGLTPTYVKEAQQLASALGISHYVLDVRERFHHCVVDNFTSEYLQGRTPNPCVQCNMHIKMKYLLEEADRLGCDYVATGHYAQVLHYNDTFYIAKGHDTRKDQSYFLWGLKQNVLSRLLLPLGGMTKDEVRSMAMQHGFVSVAQKPESQDICFVEGDYRDFLRTHKPDIDTLVGKGDFIDPAGKVIGKHKGFPFYTIGQRKGLEIALGVPAYVLQINAEKNQIMIGDKNQLLTSDMYIRDCYFPSLATLSDNEVLLIKIRYKSMPVQGYLVEWSDSHAHIRFTAPVEALTPGQSAVLYRNECVVGGGIIYTKSGL